MVSLEKIVDGFNGGIRILWKEEDKLLIGGYFNIAKDIELDRFGIVEYNLKIGEIRKIVDGFNGGINSLWKEKEELFIGGEFTEIGNIKLEGYGIVKYNLRTNKIRKVVGEFNRSVCTLLKEGDKLFIGGLFEKKGRDFILLGDGGVVEYNLETNNIRKILDGFGGPYMAPIHGVNTLWKEGDKLFMGGSFEEVCVKSWGTPKYLKLEGCGIIEYNLKINRVEVVADGFDGFINSLWKEGSKLFIGGWFKRAREITLNNYGIVVYDLETNETRKVVDGFNDLITTIWKDENDFFIGGYFNRVRTDKWDVKLKDYGIVKYSC